jgi:hypothetical protein
MMDSLVDFSYNIPLFQDLGLALKAKASTIWKKTMNKQAYFFILRIFKGSTKNGVEFSMHGQ